MKTPTIPTQTLAHRLVAHRGYSQCYPENTLSALRAALRVGARYVEFDVQFTVDRVPMVFHDEKLKRITGISGNIHQLTAAQLTAFRASEAKRFGEQFGDEPVPTLADVLQLLSSWPEVTAFVEIKHSTVMQFGVKAVAQDMMTALAAHQHNCILISFHAPVLQAARDAGMQRIAWVLTKWNDAARQQAEQLSPDILFCNYKKIPKNDVLWPGVWSWALYDVTDPAVALHWFSRGAQLIETWDIGAMLRDPRLQVMDVAAQLSVQPAAQKPARKNDGQ
ncbi:MAG: glycerophosphodiester phosphodiesterase [Gammaproteobacteria bacterium]|nr:glycerophosphodiester phosphodiesterase [Gammaproteobacteria bacterium]